MKASVLGLLVATAAFAGSSIYLYAQLQNERERAAELAARADDLDARLVQFERARGESGQRRFASVNPFSGQAVGGPGTPPPPPAGASVDEADGTPMTWSVPPPPQQSEAMQKMMRAQVRAHNKRMYADVGPALGLTRDQANKLIDLLTDQQSGGFERYREGQSVEDVQNAWKEKQNRLQAEIAELLGDDKVATLEEYQKSLPARQELEMLTRQLEGYDMAINDDQRKRLLKVMVDERDRVPEPNYVDGADMEELQKTRRAWEEDYNDRVASQARNILNTEQITAYTEYQQAQKDMRAQFGVMMPTGPRGKTGAMTISSTPGGTAVMTADAIFISAPPEPEQKK